MYGLSQKQIIEQFENLVKYAAKKVSKQSTLDVYIDVQDLYQEGMMLLHYHHKKYEDRSIEEFKAIFTSSLFRHLYQVARNKGVSTVHLDSAYDLGYEDNITEIIYFEYVMSHLKDMLKDDLVAASILQELVEPSERTVWEMAMDTKRKENLKLQGKRINVPQNTKIKMIHIRRSLGISQKLLDEGLYKIRNMAHSCHFADAI